MMKVLPRIKDLAGDRKKSIAVLLAAILLPAMAYPATAKDKEQYLPPKRLNAYSQSYSSHIASAASVLEYLGCKSKKESKAEFLAKVALFARKCLCDKPGKPYAYPLYDGLGAMNEAYGYKLQLKERYREDKSRRITFKELQEELAGGSLAVITCCEDSGSPSQRMKAVSYPVSGCKSDKSGDYLLADNNGKQKKYSFNANCKEMIVLLIRRKT